MTETGNALVIGLDTSTTVQRRDRAGGDVLAAGTVADRMAHVEQLTPLIAAASRRRASPCRPRSDRRRPRPRAVHRPARRHRQRPGAGRRAGAAAARRLQPGRARGAARRRSRRRLRRRHRRPPARGLLGPLRPRTGHGSAGPQVSAPHGCPAARGRTGRRPVRRPAAGRTGPRASTPACLAAGGPGLPDAGHEPLYLRRPDASRVVRRKSVCATAGGPAMTPATHNREVSILRARAATTSPRS